MNRCIRKPAFCVCKNKGADQLCSNCETDQRLCFCYMDSTIPLLSNSKNFKLLAWFCDCTGRIVSDLVITPNCWFSHAQRLISKSNYSLFYSSDDLIRSDILWRIGLYFFEFPFTKLPISHSKICHCPLTRTM